MGTLGTENVQGEEQKALDIIANDLFIKSVQQNGYVAGLTSEEMDDVIEVEEAKHPHGQYIVLFDPLDGSSNVNVNISVETIFSILNSENAHPTNADYLQAGTNQLCAGYALYGTSTMLVLTTGLLVSSAACMMACTCSMLLTLNAAMSWLFSAA